MTCLLLHVQSGHTQGNDGGAHAAMAPDRDSGAGICSSLASRTADYLQDGRRPYRDLDV
jgi:hypothetical protein